MPAQLAAFIDSFCFNKADGAELKTNITQTNLKPWGGWEGAGRGLSPLWGCCCEEDTWSPKGATGQPPCSTWGVWGAGP